MKGIGEQGNSLKVAILGAGGIGKVHARIFHSLGAEIYAILGSSTKTASESSNDLKQSFGFKPKAFANIEELLAEPIDAVCICTPPHLHVEHTLAAFNKGFAVFCEKPLFWNDKMSKTDMLLKLDQLKSHPSRRFMMNAPNAFFLEGLNNRINEPGKIKSFKFSFHTNGNYKGREIGVDLLTHGLSLIYKLFGLRNLSLFKSQTADNKYSCSFRFGNCKVEFDFMEDLNGSKLFLIDIDGHVFTRGQEGFGAEYNVFLLDSRTNEKIKITDPFQQSISNFLDYCKSGSPIGHDKFEEAEVIMKIMIQNLLVS